jgi:hypothetical protein
VISLIWADKQFTINSKSFIMDCNDISFHDSVDQKLRATILDRYKLLQKHRNTNSEKRKNAIDKLILQFKDKAKSLLSDKEILKLKGIVDDNQFVIAKHNLEARGNATKMDAMKKKVRKDVTTKLKKEIKHHNEVIKLKDSFLTEINKVYFVTPPSLSDVVVSFPTEVHDPPIPDPTAIFFEPPYHFSEIYVSPKNGIDESKDRSTADHTAGFVVNDMNNRQKGWEGYYNPTFEMEYLAGCGVNYIMPKTGIIEITCLAYNTFGSLSARITDDIGFSCGELDLYQSIFLNILHTNNIEISERIITSIHMVGDGDDISDIREDLQSTTPYFIRLRSTGAFAQDSLLQIVVGSRISTLTFMDDMTAHCKAKFAWFLKSINVRVI